MEAIIDNLLERLALLEDKISKLEAKLKETKREVRNNNFRVEGRRTTTFYCTTRFKPKGK